MGAEGATSTLANPIGLPGAGSSRTPARLGMAPMLAGAPAAASTPSAKGGAGDGPRCQIARVRASAGRLPREPHALAGPTSVPRFRKATAVDSGGEIAYVSIIVITAIETGRGGQRVLRSRRMNVAINRRRRTDEPVAVEETP